VVRWNGVNLPTTFVNATTLTAQVTADKIAQTGPVSVSVFTPAPGGGTSQALTLSVVNPAPVLSGINPGMATVSGSAFTLTVTGSKFVQGAVVRWNGASLPTTFVNATTLTAQVTAAKIAQTGPVSVTVFTPAPGGGESNALTLSIVNPAPVQSGLNPSQATAGGSAFTLTVTGSKFVNGSVVCWNGIDLKTTYGNSTRLTAQVPADKIASAGTASVTVYSPAPGGGESQKLTLTIRKASRSIYLPAVIR
jgi:hypothetical protein